MRKISLFLFWMLSAQCLLNAAVAEQSVVDCDPIVDLQATTLQKALSRLAEQYHFVLTFPVDADRPVESIDSMSLSQAVKYLTAEVSTVLQYEKIEGCEKAQLVSLEVLPVGEDTEYVYVKPAEEAPEQVQPQIQPAPAPAPQRSPAAEPVHIDDMELYAEEVLLNKRKMDVSLTPEQRLELNQVMQQVRARLEAEGLLEPGR
ncbi:MAG: hypothetical protein RQ936_08110 [Gammaproteobacteria bacterium]|nr:hypothetical protein [Gammaproteobacteria bacterium]